jgi:hypothetical protein
VPAASAGQSQGQPVRLVEQSWRSADPDPKALACSGVLWQTGRPEQPDRSQLWLRLVTGRPVSAITPQFLDWCTQRLAGQGISSWLLISRYCLLAHEQTGTDLDPGSQSSGQADGQGRADSAVPSA